MKDNFKFINKTPWKADLYNQFSEEGGSIPPPGIDFLSKADGGLILQANGDRLILKR